MYGFVYCVCMFAAVGHCHPHVVSAGQEQMAKLTTSAGFLTDCTSEYAKRLISTLPESLCVCFFLNSGYDMAVVVLLCFVTGSFHEFCCWLVA